MALYSLGIPPPTGSYTPSPTFLAAFDALAAATNRPSIVEAGAYADAAASVSSPVVAFGRSANTPVQIGAVAPLADDPGEKPSVTGIAVAWSTVPTPPSNMVRRGFLTSTQGSGVIWTFPRGFALAAAASAGVFVSSGTGTLGIKVGGWMVVNE